MAGLDWEQVLERVRRGEDERTELKRWEAFPNKVAAAVCALANSDGGLLVLGVDDCGEVVGVPEDPEKVREKLTSLLESGLSVPVGAVMMVRRWMELRGRGLPIIRKNMREFNGTEPELVNNTDGRFVRLTLKR